MSMGFSEDSGGMGAFSIFSSIATTFSVQLAGLLTATEDRMAERLDRFKYLCGQVKMYLDVIFDEFPNSKLPLTKTTAGEIDLMDYIVPSDFVEKCEIGD